MRAVFLACRHILVFLCRESVSRHSVTIPRGIQALDINADLSMIRDCAGHEAARVRYVESKMTRWFGLNNMGLSLGVNEKADLVRANATALREAHLCECPAD